MDNQNVRLMRWSLAIQMLNFDVIYEPGKEMGNADGLSQQALDKERVNSLLGEEGEMPGKAYPDSPHQEETDFLNTETRFHWNAVRHSCIICVSCQSFI